MTAIARATMLIRSPAVSVFNAFVQPAWLKKFWLKQASAPHDPKAQQPVSRRRTLHASALGLVEDFHLTSDCAAQSGHSPEYQVVLPYEGAVNWRVGSKTALLDSNSVLFVGAKKDYSESHLVAGVGR